MCRAVGAVDIAACKPGLRGRFQMGEQGGNGIRGGKGIGIEDIDVIGARSVAETGAHARVIARAKAAVMPRLHHAHPVPIGNTGLHRLERAIAGVVVHQHNLARDSLHGVAGGIRCFEAHVGGAPVEHDGEDAGAFLGRGHSAASRRSGMVGMASAASITRRMRAAKTRTFGSNTMESCVPGTSVTCTCGAKPAQSLSART